MINDIPKTNILIMGADLHASIRMRTYDASNKEDPSVSLYSVPMVIQEGTQEKTRDQLKIYKTTNQDLRFGNPN